jgi:hypothetical protein
MSSEALREKASQKGKIENNLRRKTPEPLGKLAVLRDRLGLVLTATAPAARDATAPILTHAPGDGRVLADAWQARRAYFVRLDRQHFLENKVPGAALPFRLGTPGEFLLWFRQKYVEKSS